MSRKIALWSMTRNTRFVRGARQGVVERRGEIEEHDGRGEHARAEQRPARRPGAPPTRPETAARANAAARPTPWVTLLAISSPRDWGRIWSFGRWPAQHAIMPRPPPRTSNPTHGPQGPAKAYRGVEVTPGRREERASRLREQSRRRILGVTMRDCRAGLQSCPPSARNARACWRLSRPGDVRLVAHRQERAIVGRRPGPVAGALGGEPGAELAAQPARLLREHRFVRAPRLGGLLRCRAACRPAARAPARAARATSPPSLSHPPRRRPPSCRAMAFARATLCPRDPRARRPAAGSRPASAQ